MYRFRLKKRWRNLIFYWEPGTWNTGFQRAPSPKQTRAPATEHSKGPWMINTSVSIMNVPYLRPRSKQERHMQSLPETSDDTLALCSCDLCPCALMFLCPYALGFIPELCFDRFSDGKFFSFFFTFPLAFLKNTSILMKKRSGI